jgi:transcription termination factor Rho
MTERRRPPRRGRGTRAPNRTAAETLDDSNPYREEPSGGSAAGGDDESSPAPERPPRERPTPERAAPAERPAAERSAPASDGDSGVGEPAFSPPPPAAEPIDARTSEPAAPAEPSNGTAPPRYDNRGERPDRGDNRDQRGEAFNQNRNGRRRRNRGRGPRREHQQPQQPTAIAPSGDTRGWFDPARDGGFIRRASNSYLAESGDAFVPPQLVRQYGLRKSDLVEAAIGRDQRGRLTAIEIRTINEVDPATAARRPEFNSLPAAYPERKLFLETGRPAKSGGELIRRAIDLIAPIGYGQRGLIVAPARAGKTTLLHAITEGIAINHPNAALIILLVDERPEEVSEAISWGVGEVIASSFDQPAERHVEVTEMVLERSRRLVEVGRDVVIVLDSLTRMARAHNTVERGSGRTLSGGLDATAMAKPKAFFGSARAIPESSGGGSLTIIATALVETGSRMDDVIFEEFKGTGNCEIKLDRGLAEKRIYPAIDIGTSGTRREEKLFRPDQLDGVYTLRRGLSQMPPQSAMEWLIKRIAGTPSNDALLAGL